MNSIFKNKRKKVVGPNGFAMLFTVLIVSVILAISLGVSGLAYKQSVLSSTARISSIAFAQADRGAECGQYVETKLAQGGTLVLPPSVDCGGVTLAVAGGGTGYTLTPPSVGAADPCFIVEVSYTPGPTPTPGNPTPSPGVTIISNGYSSCDLSSLRTVERTLEVKF